jgi:hypothetical protein
VRCKRDAWLIVAQPTVVQALATAPAAAAPENEEGNRVQLYTELTGLTITDGTEDSDSWDCVLKATDGGGF